MTSYERDIDEECKQMWDSVMLEKMKTTSTKVRAIVDKHFGKRLLEVEAKTNEHEGALAAIKRGIMNIAGAFDKKK